MIRVPLRKARSALSSWPSSYHHRAGVFRPPHPHPACCHNLAFDAWGVPGGWCRAAAARASAGSSSTGRQSQHIAHWLPASVRADPLENIWKRSIRNKRKRKLKIKKMVSRKKVFHLRFASHLFLFPFSPLFLYRQHEKSDRQEHGASFECQAGLTCSCPEPKKKARQEEPR